MTMLLAEDLLLLLLDDVRGSTPAAVSVDEVLGGALLTELALTGAVEVRDGGGWGRAGRVVPTPLASDPAGPAADPVLGPALTRVGERPRTAQDLVGLLGRGLRPTLIDRLAGRGLIRRQEDRVLGLFPRTRWPAADVRYEAAVRQRLADVLVRGVQPDPRTVALVALLQAVDQVPAVVDHTGMSRREVKQRARLLAEGEWAAEAVRKAVEATTGAMAAVMVATTAAAAGASS
jgi:hypothetical protein